MRSTRLELSWIVLAVGSLAGQGTKTAAFDVASVRPSEIAIASGEGSRREEIHAEPGSLSMRNVSLSSCIQWAFEVRPYQVSGPGWLRDQRYDISAKSDGPVREAELRRMLQS